MRALLVLVVGVGATVVAWACCLAYSLSNPMSLVDEKAIIVWDPDMQMEHFVRQASFEGDAQDFGFIVPAPTEPTVAEASDEAFSALEEYVAGQVVRAATKGTDSVAAEAGAGGVDVIDQYMVGDFEVSILRATSGGSMLDWLKENNYTNRPAMEEWLDHYTKMGWYFAALKFVREEDADTPETKAVRVSFKTDVPFYPYKMPSDTWPKGHYRPIALYFVSNGIARGQYRQGGGNWEAREHWSGDLPREQAMELASNIGLKPEDIPEDATLTVFANTRNAQGYDSDVYFLTYHSVLPTWAVFGVLGALVAIVVWLVVKKRSARAPLAD